MSLHAKIELALLANGGVEWDKNSCECDPEVGQVPCRYCAIHHALTWSNGRLEHLQALEAIAEKLANVVFYKAGESGKEALQAYKQWKEGGKR